MREPHAGVAGRDVDVLVVHGVVADEGEVVDRLHDLAAPVEFDLLHHREAAARPRLELAVALRRVVRLAALVVLAADDEQIVVQPDVVVGVARVAGEHLRHRAARHARADHVGHVGRLLRVQRDTVVNWHICRHDERVAGDDVPADVNERRHAAFDVVGVAVAENAAAHAQDRLREPGEILQRVELTLPREMQARAAIPAVRRALDEAHVFQAGAVRGVELALERLALVALSEEEIAVEPREVAVDVLAPHDFVDALDRRAVAVGGHPDRFRAVQLLQLVVAVIEHVGEVAGRHARHAGDERAVVEHGDRQAGLGEVVGGAEARYARADDADVGMDVFFKRPAVRQEGGGGPDGFVAGHGAPSLAKNAPRSPFRAG